MYSRQSLHSTVGLALIGEIYTLGKRFNGGSYGQLHLGKNMIDNEYVAIKLEAFKAGTLTIRLEFECYKRLGQHAEGIPRVHYLGTFQGRYHVMVMELLGKSLADLFHICNRKFSLKTVLILCMQLLHRIEYIHSQGLVYRGVKPDNFLLGRKAKKREMIIHIVDFGYAKNYVNQNTNEHIAYKTHMPLIGTTRYMSINAHMGREQSRRDDLEALGYVFLYFLRGSLPWQGIHTDNALEHNERVCEVKRNTPLEVLCAGHPQEFAKYLKYVRGLSFYEMPNYGEVFQMFNQLFLTSGFKNDGIFDWSEKVVSESLLVKKDPEP